MDTMDRRHPLPAAPPLFGTPLVRPVALPPPATARRSGRPWVAVALALAVVAAGVVAVMQTAALSGVRADLDEANTHGQALEQKVDSLRGRLDEATDELETAKDDLGRAHVYGAACRAALGAADRVMTLTGQAGLAYQQGDIERARSLIREVKSTLRDVEDDYRVCMTSASSADAEML